MPPLSPGQLVDRYKVVRLIAAGGFGAVYEVENEAIGQRYAMKVLTLNADPGIVARFMNEARAVNAIRHPNIPQVYDFGALPDGTPFLVMEFLDGQSLDSRLAAQRRIPLPETLEMASDVASAVAAAHAKDIIHRDLKPANVMQVSDAEKRHGWRSKVLDFGIAKLATENLTKSKIALGTPTHMAPEQMEDASSVDGRADVYPLGMMIYQCLAGRLPYEWEPKRGPFALMLAKESPFAPIRRYAPEVPAELQEFIMRMMSRERTARPTIGEVEETLARAQGITLRTGAKITGAVVTVGGPAALTGSAQDSDDLDPTSSALMDGDAPGLSKDLAGLPSVSGSLVQPAIATPSEQVARGEISPGKDAPPVLIPKSISDVPSMPMALPPIKASPEDRTAQPAPTQGIPVALALPHALTAAPPPSGLNETGPARQTPTSLQWLFVFVGAVGALGLAATLAVLLWPRATPSGVAPSAPQTPPALQTPTGAGLAVAVPAQKVVSTPPELTSVARADQPTDKFTERVPGNQTGSTADRPPDKGSDKAADKGNDKPKSSHRCSATMPTRSCIRGRALSSGNIDKVAQALRDSRVRLCPSEQLIIEATSRGFRISEAPERVSRGIRDDLVLTLGGLLVDIPAKMGEIVVQCDGAP